MTTEDLIESFIEEGVKSYKKLYRNTPEGCKLDRHETVTLKEGDFSCWRELTVYKMAEYVTEILSDIKVEVELDGNNSSFIIENITDEQIQRLNNVLYCFLRQFNKI